MRVQLLSDLHLEFHRDAGASFVASLDPAGVDVLVLAGDVADARCLPSALDLICRRYAEATVVFVAGNHEYYGSDPRSALQLMREIEAETPNLVFLENDVLALDGRRIIGTTLWFPDDPLNALYAPQLRDFAVIRDFVPWVYRQNESAVSFLEREVPTADLVVTHHIPSDEAVAPEWRGSGLNRFFVCDLSELITEAQPALWCFGHTHTPGEFRLGATRLVTNPFGYPFEAKEEFHDRLVFEL